MKPFGSIMEFWAMRSPRERRMLASGAACLCLVLFYVGLWDPGLTARKRLLAALPVMRAQVEQMRVQREEITALRKLKPTGTASSDIASLLKAAATRGVITNSLERIDALSPQRARVVSRAMAFDAWVRWVGELQRDFGIRIESCNLVALEAPGMVRMDTVFAIQGETAR